ncbi:PIN domain-containing protein [Phascolarctobacterium sp.]|uniref:PIN domain-containing protein n=1 Tax=Phascolarctobacterium sp. TaxID=2049039 RepID=UPI0030286765
MRALLDTNIIIHRENRIVSNYSVGHLYRWLDKLKYDKIIHPYSISEIEKYQDEETQSAIKVKLDSYQVLKTLKEPDSKFLELLCIPERSENDKIDNCLLFEVYSGRVDFLITEDKGIRNKAAKIGLINKVFSINAFISKVTAENPQLIEYEMLAVKKNYFGNVNVQDSFFDSLRNSYKGFNEWFISKCDEEAYVCYSEKEEILGFLYLKTEDENEPYSDIVPPFKPMRRLKVGTFKIESTGFRLGERFIKIIFDNAIQRNVEEIYVTLFMDRDELATLVSLLERWGFTNYGIKNKNGKGELVFVKKMNVFRSDISPQKNFPNIRYNCKKFILPIVPRYHTTLLPDSKLNNENEVDFLGREPHRYALQKVYISWANSERVSIGDLILFYRMGEAATNKKYTSVITTVAIVDKIIDQIDSEQELINICKNRSVFSDSELRSFWSRYRLNLKIIKFVFVKSLNKRLTLGYLWEKGIIPAPNGPRPFLQLTDEQYDGILEDSQTMIKYIE